MTKHTKGPWKVELGEHRVGPYKSKVFEIWNQAYHVATIHEHIDKATNDEANARLIAAAPELLCVLKHLSRYCRDYLSLDDEAEAIVKDALIAIAKAEGRDE